VRRNGLFGAIVDTFPLPAVVTRKAVFVGSTLYERCSSFYGSIGEFILYDRALVDAEVLFVEGYLRDKFGCCT
jgi:hypothetical protein